MATITYQFFQSTPAGMLTPTLTGNQMLPSLAALDGGGFVMVSNTGGLADLEAVAFDQLAPVRTGLFSQPAVNATTAGHQFGAQTVGLSGGGWVTVYNDTSAGQSEVRARFFASDGTALGSDFLISSGAGDPDVVGGIAELANGNVAVTYQKNIQSTNGDIWVRVMTDTGTPVSSLAVDTSINVDSLDPAIAGLSGGGFVVVWVERAADNSTEIYARRYDASNAAIGGKTLIDTGGSVNDQPEVLALADGGYAIAYRDNGWNARSGDDITMKIFNGDGSARSGLIRANSGDLAGAQSDPHLAQLDNGFIVLTWTSDNTAGSSETSIYSRIFAADGTAITSTTAIAADPVATEAHCDVIGLGSG